MARRIQKGSDTTEKGYIRITAGKWAGHKLHRLIAAWCVVKRPLRRGEVVDHIDGDPSNFHPSNLRVMPKKKHDALSGRRRRKDPFMNL